MRNAVAACVILAAGAAVYASRGSALPAGELPAYASIERDGLRYEFDALTGRERLYEGAATDADLPDVSGARPADVRRLRAALEKQLGVPSLDVLRAAHRDAADALRRLGYL